MRSSFESWEQENWDREHRLDRDEHREPARRRRLTAVPLVDAGVLQPPVKLCAVGVDHEAVKTTPAWEQLPYVGRQDAYDDEGNELEMRNCACHSTLCKLVPGGAR